MIVTDDFVFVHMSKTGGRFVAMALRRALTPKRVDGLLHRLAAGPKPLRRGRRPGIRLPLPFYPYKYREVGGQHSYVRHIPAR